MSQIEQIEKAVRPLTPQELVDLKAAAIFRYESGLQEHGYPDGRDFAILCLLKTMESK